MLQDEIQAIYVKLGAQAGIDPVLDAEHRGRIQAALAIVQVTYDDLYLGGAE